MRDENEGRKGVREASCYIGGEQLPNCPEADKDEEKLERRRCECMSILKVNSGVLSIVPGVTTHRAVLISDHRPRERVEY